MTIRQVVEDISKRDDRSCAVVFFSFFARFEYALKRGGFVVAKSEEAKADWEAFAHKQTDLIQKNKDKDFVEAVAYLEKFPPKKQIVIDGRLEWSADKFSGTQDLARILCLVRRIRNNLFHGGKFQSGVEAELSRDRKLLDSGLVIMQACLEADNALHGIFVEGLTW